MTSSKRELRQQIKKKLKEIPEEIFSKKGKALSKHLVQLLSDTEKSFSIHNIETLGAFAPLPDEADWTSEWNLGVNLAFPAMANGEAIMAFFQVELNQLEVRHDFGVEVKVPPKECPRVEPDAILVPGLAFTRDGHRMGRGKGFYDKYLKNFSGIKIGICLEEQLVNEIPMDPHDIVMDFIITDKEFIQV